MCFMTAAGANRERRGGRVANGAVHELRDGAKALGFRQNAVSTRFPQRNARPHEGLNRNCCLVA